ncbi:hypothetical protein E2C00_00280 [Streptomyces sp. WAC05374]|uniref:hypothetical protein n=1 Tax=Streptomyces sp. WAC05374 TaxID=2487420 RepID=UPI000F899586|nr:hypothetical protein [Streptomyces sp. WAC05374]RST19635.1 hypothetical protein EF905_00665 [Streptomyces sp. WAC05374]TDF50028.1 hypothetical protein E2B92_00255 [Streptomyces sp. WAC05374]TDF57754.1 hypothetical protein E2C02_08045 [Streptomyces sp. WAC05374]TDF60282.1 hypothetical protein E2C00_00280 [Streptomyces sp. WAC05374]
MALLVFGLSGCALLGDDRPRSTALKERELKVTELVGGWEGEGGARLTMTERDQRFVAKGLQADKPEQDGLPVDTDGRVSGKGTWSFDKYTAGYQVDLHFQGPGDLTLTVAELDGELVISSYVNDGDEFLLHRS